MATTDGTALRDPRGGIVRVDVTPVLDTSIYAAGDALHTNDLKLPGMGRVNGGAGVIRSVLLLDKDDQNVNATLWLFRGELTNTTHTANAAFNLHDDDLTTFVGAVLIDSYFDGVSNRAAFEQPALYYQCASSDTALYAVLVTAGTPTHTASGLTLRLIAEVY